MQTMHFRERSCDRGEAVPDHAISEWVSAWAHEAGVG
jgi:hypothetical protein